MQNLIQVWNKEFGLKCVTLAQALKNERVEDQLACLAGNHDATPRVLAQLISRNIGEAFDGLVLTVSHISSKTQYYQVVTVEQYESWYVRPNESLSDEDLDFKILNTRGTVKFEAFAEHCRRTGRVIDSNEYDGLLVRDGTGYRPFNPFSDELADVVGVANGVLSVIKTSGVMPVKTRRSATVRYCAAFFAFLMLFSTVFGLWSVFN